MAIFADNQAELNGMLYPLTFKDVFKERCGAEIRSIPYLGRTFVIDRLWGGMATFGIAGQ
jgi:hypothetical protein